MNQDKNKIQKVIEVIPIISEQKKKFSWIDKTIRWANRIFLGWWICKKRGL